MKLILTFRQGSSIQYEFENFIEIKRAFQHTMQIKSNKEYDSFKSEC